MLCSACSHLAICGVTHQPSDLSWALLWDLGLASSCPASSCLSWHRAVIPKMFSLNEINKGFWFSSWPTCLSSPPQRGPIHQPRFLLSVPCVDPIASWYLLNHVQLYLATWTTTYTKSSQAIPSHLPTPSLNGICFALAQSSSSSPVCVVTNPSHLLSESIWRQYRHSTAWGSLHSFPWKTNSLQQSCTEQANRDVKHFEIFKWKGLVHH